MDTIKTDNLINSAQDYVLEYGVLPENMSKDEFLVKALYFIATDESTPDDIFYLTDFAPVKKEHKQLYIVSGTANADYTAKIGVDRKEKVLVAKDAQGKSIYREVTKTDWQDYEGKYEGESSAYLLKKEGVDEVEPCDEEREAVCREIIEKAIFTSCEKKQGVVAPKAPTKDFLEKAEKELVAKSPVFLPTQKYKDLDKSGSATVSAVKSVVLPEYTLTYTYKGNDYHKRSFSDFNDSRCVNKMGNANVEDIYADKTESKLKYFNIGLLALFVLSLILIVVLPYYALIIPLICVDALAFLGVEQARRVISKKEKKKNAKWNAFKSLLRRKGMYSLYEKMKEQGRL